MERPYGPSTPETIWHSCRIEWMNCGAFEWQFVCSIWDEFQFISGVDTPLGSRLHCRYPAMAALLWHAVSMLTNAIVPSVADPGFWSGGPSRVLTPGGSLNQQLAQNKGFSLKIA